MVGIFKVITNSDLKNIKGRDIGFLPADRIGDESSVLMLTDIFRINAAIEIQSNQAWSTYSGGRYYLWVPGSGPVSSIDSFYFDFSGQTGRASFTGGDRTDVLVGGLGRDGLHGGRDADRLDGGPNDDYLIGGQGPDVLIGGPGSDKLRGGDDGSQPDRGDPGERREPGDRFVFASDDSLPDAPDLILDFQTRDRIDLRQVDADDETASGNGTFRWVDRDDLSAAFSGRAGELRYDATGPRNTGKLLGDLDGDKIVDFELHINFLDGEQVFRASNVLL